MAVLNHIPGRSRHLKRVDEYGSVRIASYASASKLELIKVDGVALGYKPSHWTAYA